RCSSAPRAAGCSPPRRQWAAAVHGAARSERLRRFYLLPRNCLRDFALPARFLRAELKSHVMMPADLPLPNQRVAKKLRQIAAWLGPAFCVAGFVFAAPVDAGTTGLAVAGVAGPSRVLLTEQHPALTKPVTVVITNLGPEEKTIPDVATL